MRLIQNVSAAIAICIAMPSIAAAADIPRLPEQAHIVVVGSGSAEAEADYFDLTIGVETSGETSEEALDDVNETLLGIVEALLELDIEEDDISINAPRVNIEYDYGETPSVPVGVEALRTIDIKLRDIDNFETVVNTAAEYGATRISKPTERSEREADLLVQAQQKAIQQAHERAEVLASGFNRSLGPVHGVATGQAREWDYLVGSRGGGLFASASREDEMTLTYTPKPVSRRAYVYAVFLLGDDAQAD